MNWCILNIITQIFRITSCQNPQTRQQQEAPPQNKEVSVETFRRAYDWLHNLDRMDYIPERDKAILGANLDDLRGKFKNEYNDVCTRLKDPFDELTKYIKKEV